MVFNIFYTSQYCTDYQYSYDFDFEQHKTFHIVFDKYLKALTIRSTVVYTDYTLYTNKPLIVYNYLTNYYEKI
jgi:hypothetical protein